MDTTMITRKSNLLAPPFLQMWYVEEIDAFCLVDQRGEILSHDEFKELVSKLEVFYRTYSPQDIADTNNYNQTRVTSQGRDGSDRKESVSKHVYLIRKINGDCKIGVTSNLKTRLSQIRTVEPKVILLHSFYADDAYKCEKFLHDFFWDQNVGGEWFDLASDDIESMKSITEYKDGEFIRGNNE